MLLPDTARIIAPRRLLAARGGVKLCLREPQDCWVQASGGGLDGETRDSCRR